MDEGKPGVNVNSQVQGLVIGDGTVNNNFYSSTEQIDRGTRLTFAGKLRPESFKLGDSAAAKFPYIITPIQSIYDRAVQALYDASSEVDRIKHGILILGESNTGKTRLALEALMKTLPDYHVLRWRPDYPINFAPPIDFIQDKNLILFIDDLQDYASAPLRDPNSQISIADPRSTTLRTLTEILFQATDCTVVIATCRIEDQQQTQTAFNWLFVQLAQIFLPSFSTNPQDLEATQIILEFQKRGTIHIEDWDGTLGSLVLGLSTKNTQYLALPALSKSVLQAMKLLEITNTRRHTEQRIRAVCSEVFRKKELMEDEETWHEAINRLTLIQFIKEEIDEDSHETTLIIRKDTYFEKIVTDYPLHYRHHQIEQDLAKLQKVFVELGDSHGLYNVGRKYADLDRYKEATVAFDHALALNPNDSTTWILKGLMYGVIGGPDQPEEALIAFDHGLALNPSDSHAWSFKGRMLGALNRYEEAFVAANQAIKCDPNNADAWIVKGHALEALNQHAEALAAFNQALAVNPNDADTWYYKGSICKTLDQYEEALAAFDHATSLNPNNTETWYNKGLILGVLGKFAEALTAFDHAVSLDLNNIDAWYNKGLILGVLNQPAEALAAFDHVISLNPTNADAWHFKGRMLVILMQPEEGLTAIEYSISLDPTNAEAWFSKGILLGAQEYHKYEEGLVALEYSLSLDPTNAEAWEYKGRILKILKRYEKALDSFDHTLTLDPDNADARKNIGLLRKLKREKEARKVKPQVKKLRK